MKLAVIGENFQFLQEECYSGERSVKINSLLTDYLMDYKNVVCVTNLDPGVGFIWSYLAIEENLPLVGIIPTSNFSTDFCALDEGLYKEMIGYKNMELLIYGSGDVTEYKKENRNRHIIYNSDITLLLGSSTIIKNLSHYANYLKKEIITISTEQILKL